MASLPAWRHFDPVPILNMDKKGKEAWIRRVKEADKDRSPGTSRVRSDSSGLRERSHPSASSRVYHQIFMKRSTPLLWISFGLVSLTLSILLMSDLTVNLIPNPAVEIFQYRQKYSEALAVQYSLLAEKGDSRGYPRRV